MKRVFAIILVLAMVLSMGIGAFAADTGSITVTNATKDQKYNIYKIFDANYSDDATKAVAYSIETTDQFFAPLFGTDGKTENPFFVYNENTGSVSKKEGVNDTELIAYLDNLVTTGSFATAKPEVIATGDTVAFTGLPYGYYMIYSSLGAAVTINSNTPDVEVIDKNQLPGSGFDKEIVLEDGTTVSENSANIGDVLDYQITFQATNYDGASRVKYYQIYDEFGSGLHTKFSSMKVYIDGAELANGYFLNNTSNTIDIDPFLGTWTAEKVKANADWYLVYYDTNKFRVTIPWLTKHTLESSNGVDRLVFAEDAESKFESPVDIKVTYCAVVDVDATIGGGASTNLYNRANGSWTNEKESGSTQPDEVVTNVYGIGLLKDDSATGENLAGAEFRIYSDAACTKPVYVVPTNIDGVYMLDSLGREAESVKGAELSRNQISTEKLNAYLNGKSQENLVVSQANGKLAVLGLEAGTYYLRETKAPDGYNALTAPVEFTTGTDQTNFIIYANASGEVSDQQAETGEYREHIYTVTYKKVSNSKGLELPSTGGAGTMMLITFGSFLAMAFAVLLITQKKMSIYKD